MSSVEAISFRRLSWERSNLSDESDWEVDEEVGAGTGKGSGRRRSRRTEEDRGVGGQGEHRGGGCG